MKTKLTVLGAVLALTAAGMVAFIGWRLHDHQKARPEVSVFTHGTLVRAAPYRYCQKNDVTVCDPPGDTVRLPVNETERVQLSVDREIAGAPWMLSRIYAPADDPEHLRSESTVYRNHRATVTIDTVDHTGQRLVGLEIKLPTVVLSSTGEVSEVAHAIWSVATVWADQQDPQNQSRQQVS